MPVQDRAVRRRERLLDAAAALLDRDGWEALTTRNLAAEAGVGVGTVYDYFVNRDAVLAALLERYEARLWDDVVRALSTANNLEEAAVAALDALARLWFEEPGYARVWLGTQASELLERTGAAWSVRFEVLVAGVIAGEVGEDAPVVASAAVHLVSGMLLGAAMGPAERRDAIVREARIALVAYIRARIGR